MKNSNDFIAIYANHLLCEIVYKRLVIEHEYIMSNIHILNKAQIVNVKIV